MKTRILVLICGWLLLFFLGQTALAQNTETQKVKQQIAKQQNEIARLKKKLAQTKSASQKKELQNRLAAEQKKVQALKDKIYPPAAASGRRLFIKLSTAEASYLTTLATLETEEKISGEGEVFHDYNRSRHELGLTAGYFAGGNAYLLEVRSPWRLIVGPATTSLRATTGLVISAGTERRFIPLGIDLIFNVPPGIITGVPNYLGFGLNYVAVTSGRVSGTLGGQVFYGVEGDGFGGTIFGELGYGLLRTGFSPSQKGVTIMVGYRLIYF